MPAATTSAVTTGICRPGLEVALGQAVEVERGQELPHLPRPALEEGQEAALEAFLQAPEPGPALRFPAAEEGRHLFLQKGLEEALDLLACPCLQSLPTQR